MALPEAGGGGGDSLCMKCYCHPTVLRAQTFKAMKAANVSRVPSKDQLHHPSVPQSGPNPEGHSLFIDHEAALTFLELQNCSFYKTEGLGQNLIKTKVSIVGSAHKLTMALNFLTFIQV